MHDERQGLEVSAVGTVNAVPAFDFRLMSRHQDLRLVHFRTAWMRPLARGKPLLSVLQGLLRLPQPPADGQRIALDQVMDEVAQVRYTQARQSRFGQLDQRRGPVAYQGP